MQEVRGNLWTHEPPPDVRAVTTNGVVRTNGRLVMGVGCALEARERHPGIDTALGALVRTHGNHVHYVPRSALVSFPVKEHYRMRASVALIEQSARELVALADAHAWTRVLVPRPGCGAGGLDWLLDVRPVLQREWDARFIVISPPS